MVSANYPPLIGGPAASVPYLSEELVKKGHETFVLTTGCPGYPRVNEENGVVVYRTSPTVGEVGSLRVIGKKILKMSGLGRKIVEREKIDIIHSHDTNISGVVGAIINLRKNKKSLVKYSGDLAWEFLSLKGKALNTTVWMKRSDVRVLLKLQNKIIGRYDKIIATSENERRVLEKMGAPKPIEVIPNGVVINKYEEKDIEKVKKKIKPNQEKIVMAASRLVVWKGLDFLIKAVKVISKKKSDVKLVILGLGPEKERLEKLSKELGLGEKVVFLGKVPHEKVQLYFRAGDVVAVPSLYEPFGIVILDAFAAGKPVIATKVGGVPEIIKNGENGILTKPGRATNLANEITTILENRKLRERLTRNAKKTVKKYEWKNLVKKIIKTYESL
jgi:glycosyltransferase involved in cell wall biosynthesis